VVAKIDAADLSSGGGGSLVRLDPVMREGGPGTRVRARVSIAREGEEGREGQGQTTDDEELARPAMARRRDPLGGGTHTKMEIDEGLGRGKRVRQRLSHDLYRLGRRGGSNSRANWPLMAMAAVTTWWGGSFGS
jgi:hypothetical protein